MIDSGLPTDNETRELVKRHFDAAANVKFALAELLDFIDRAGDHELQHAYDYEPYKRARAALLAAG